MSEYDKSHNYDLYEYHPTTRPQQGPDYPTFAPHQTYSSEYVGTQAQVPSGLPQSAGAFHRVPAVHSYGTHDPNYYTHTQLQYPAYVDHPRPLPEIISYTPNQGQQGTKVTVYLQSMYDLDVPQVTPVVMFGQRRCQSVLTKTVQPGQQYQYALAVDAPPLTPTMSPSPQVPLSLTFEESSVAWQPPSVDFGSFTYLEQPTFYSVQSPGVAQKKRKLSPEASPRRSPSKKPSLQHLTGPASANQSAKPLSPFRRPSVPEPYPQSRRFSGPDMRERYNTGLPRMQSQQFYGAGQTTPLVQTTQSPTWSYPQISQSATQSPSAAAIATGGKTPLQPSPASGTNPPLIRTSTLQMSPTTPGPVTSTTTQSFNPYTMYPPNTKALLKLDGDLTTMTEKWTDTEWDASRRLVQFRRSQTGSVITATFEPVTLEDRIPNSICVSCIHWREKRECYVTSVDTIQLLESLVAVRFTVEEKNRIRRNLEGFRPATVSKTKQDSEEFFKLIMGFPNPKPRNIEKDVKVFPWRILATALKKIIGKYSASYSSTAGVLHTPGTGAGPGYSASRVSDVGIEHPHARALASPLSTSSSATSHGNTYAANIPTNPYSSHIGAAGLGIGPPAGPPDLRLTVPVSAAHQTTSWHQPSANYATELSATGRGSWDFPGTYMNASPATGLPGSARPYQYSDRVPPLTSQGTIPAQARFVPYNYEDQSHQTSNA